MARRRRAFSWGVLLDRPPAWVRGLGTLPDISENLAALEQGLLARVGEADRRL